MLQYVFYIHLIFQSLSMVNQSACLSWYLSEKCELCFQRAVVWNVKFNAFLCFYKAQKKLEVERYKEEKLIEQQSKVLSKQLKELCEVEERAAQANILRKAFR